MEQVSKRSTVAGTLCKILAFVVLAGGIILGFKAETLLLGISGGVVSCLVLYVFGEIVDQLSCLNSNVCELYEMLETIEKDRKAPEGQPHSPSRPSQPSQPRPEPNRSPMVSPASIHQKTAPHNEWVCSKCGTKNPIGSICCKECGSYR